MIKLKYTGLFRFSSRNKILVTIAVLNIMLFITTIFQAKGQACCSGGIPLSNQAGIRPVSSGTWDLSLMNHLNVLKTTYSGTHRIDDNLRKRINNTLFLQGIYGISPGFSVNTLFTWVANNRIVNGYNGNTERTFIAGPGDILIILQYRLFERQKHNFWIGIGSKIPTGRNNLTDRNSGILLSRDAQPGSGSWDFTTSAIWQYNPDFRPSINISIETVLKLNTIVIRSDPVYRFGYEFQTTLSVSDFFVRKNLTLSPLLQLKYWQTLPDKTGDATFPNTGGQWFYLSPSLSLGLSHVFSFFTVLDLPVSQNLTGTQLTTTFRFTAGLRISAGQQSPEIIPGTPAIVR